MSESQRVRESECQSVRVSDTHQQTLGALPGSTVVLIDGIVIHSTYSVCRNVYELRSAPVVLL